MPIIEADIVRDKLFELFDQAMESGRFRAASAIARAMSERELGFPEAKELLGYSELARRIADRARNPFEGKAIKRILGEPDIQELKQRDNESVAWLVETRIHLIRRMAADLRLDDALIQWVSTAELFPLLWAERLDVSHQGLRNLTSLGGSDCKKRRYLSPPHRLTSKERESVRLVARAAAMCSNLRCDICPLAKSGGKLWEDGRGAELSSFLDTGAGKIRSLRNKVVHFDGKPPSQLGPELNEAIESEIDTLRSLNTPRGDDILTLGADRLATLLALVFKDIVGRDPFDPFAVIEKLIHGLIERLPVRSPQRPGHS